MFAITCDYAVYTQKVSQYDGQFCWRHFKIRKQVARNNTHVSICQIRHFIIAHTDLRLTSAAAR